PQGASQPAPQSTRSARPGASGVVRGTVKDDTGGVIPGASVTLTDANGNAQKSTAGADGSFVFRGVAPGTYTVSSAYSGLQPKPVTVTVTPGQPANAAIVMTVSEQKQEVTVTDTGANEVSTEASSNASALVLKQEDLDALPDDPDDLQADLEALAGPSAGPGGNQIYIDGFTGGRLPPKESIREIRINSNPFSAEFEKLGYGRIQIFTKPGTDKFHGTGFYEISDGVWNSRNPFLSVNPPFRTQQFGGNVSGPIGKHASFFVDLERRNIDDNGIITATIPTGDFQSSFSNQTFFSTPQRRTTVSPRLDYQLGANNTLSFRYAYLTNDHIITHIGSFDVPQTTVGGITLPSNGYSQSVAENSFQMVETSVLNVHVVNETHFQFDRSGQNTTSSSTAPQLNVSQSFVSGGSGYSSPAFAAGLGYGTTAYANSYDNETGYEFQNYTTATWGAHTTKFGVRIRATKLEDFSPLNFNGQYAFLGGTFPVLGASNTPTGATTKLSSIQQYLTTERLLQSGLNSTQVSALGYGPSKFTINTGNPYISFYQLDVGPFIQDDWRVRPNLTMSFGLRWESQTNINDHSDWAPRFGFAWAPGSRSVGGIASRPKTVIRGGWGIFYERFGISSVQQAYLYGLSGASETQYTWNNPTIYDAGFSSVPPLSALTANNSFQHFLIDRNLQAPRLMQGVIGVDRQLFGHTTLSINLMQSRGVHQLITDDLNAPIPIFGACPPGESPRACGTLPPNLGRPFGSTLGDLYDYQSTGVYKQVQGIVGVNSQVGRWLTLFSRYSYSQAHADTEGLKSFPNNPYNIAADWGHSSLGIHHTLFIGGSMTGLWGLRFSPFIIARTGMPYNITTGTDLYGVNQITPSARPSPLTSIPGQLQIPQPLVGSYFNANPLVGAPLIERNYAFGPGSLSMNLRVSRTWGFGSTKFQGQVGGARAGGGGFGGGGHGGHEHGGGPGGGGPFGFGGGGTEHRYNITFSASARNILNHENPNTPNGALTSPYFTKSTGISGGFGPESTASNQRRIELQVRFAF
ncbi:MAG: TonB-dependent receptor, partial [Acidobacteriaceae bacterium]|nr:TonB-dependent receptor [Acidobacteriaceae bacterium]